ncbi:hypothetical protein [Nocardioides convexus]|uniref:hypothetical protein n=1 Tax=Nocardioides convexus TaxID=2712224 RepID=UPI0024186747|nr:hypothetical protein [Nocardioides convexus]
MQEGITNATKHAPAAALHVLVAGSATEGVDVVLRNAIGFGPTRTPGAGLGLVGLTERAEPARRHPGARDRARLAGRAAGAVVRAPGLATVGVRGAGEGGGRVT